MVPSRTVKILGKPLLASIVLALAGVGIWLALARPTNPPRAPHAIVLVTLDTLRADHLGCYGYVRDTSPFIDSLARKGVIFTNAFAPMATTSPSHASLFTSLYPLQHGVRKNGHVLDDSFLTMAELLRERGYETAGFVSTDRHFGAGNLKQGFQIFDEAPPSHPEFRPSEETIDRAIAWLTERTSSDRLFLWVHLFDAHGPYIPHHRFPPQSKADERRLLQFLIEQHQLDVGFFRRSHKRILTLMGEYDGEVAALDRAVKRLFETVEQRLGKADTLWILTSDHGEGLGNHRWLGHTKMIYNEQLRTPLILYSSSGSLPGRKIEHVVENVDLLPTVAALVGGSLESQAGEVQGSSWLPLLNGAHDRFPDKQAFAERREFLVEEHGGTSKYEKGEKYALQDRRHKYILRTEGGDEFFDVVADPYETYNLITVPSPERDRMREALLAKVAHLKRNATVSPKLVDEATQEKLRALGYVP
jgi:arylsulfatase A-like enzyme